MALSSLRAIAKESIDARRLVDTWQKRGIDCRVERLPQSDYLVMITATREEEEWSGFIDLAEWLAAVSPDLAAMARHHKNSLDHVMAFFIASKQPLTMPVPELAYTQCRLTKFIKKDHLRKHMSQEKESQSYISLMTPQGKIWLSAMTAIPRAVVNPLSDSAAQSPLPLVFVMGHSHITPGLLKTVTSGDVLLINQINFDVMTGDYRIAKFFLNEEGMLAMQKADQVNHPAVIEKTPLINDIPIQLTFILQRKTIMVGELDQLYRGQCLPFDPDAEKSIEIVSGGFPIARGELVELEGNLGVEIKEIIRR